MTTEINIKSIRGIDIGLGESDQLVAISAKLEARYPGHLILIQKGTFLNAFNKSAYALHQLKNYKLKLSGPAAKPHLTAGFPVSNYRARLWSLVEKLAIPYVVAIGSQKAGFDLQILVTEDANTDAITSISDDIVGQVIEDLLKGRDLLKTSTAKKLANPQTETFLFKAEVIRLDDVLLQDLLRMPRDIRTTWGENLRVCMARLVERTFLYGNEDNKPQLLKLISADIDQLKHYIGQAQRLSRLSINFEHRVSLVVELGRLAGGLIRVHGERP
jgi:hypothetical protein